MQAGELQLGSEMSLLVLMYFTDPRVSENKIFHSVICVQLGAFLRGIMHFSLADGSVFWRAVPCWELAHRHVRGTWAGLRGHGPYPNMGQLPGVV